MIINRVTTPKKMPINRQVITFYSMVASGMERPMMAIIKAMAVPSGIPLATNTSTMRVYGLTFSCFSTRNI